MTVDYTKLDYTCGRDEEWLKIKRRCDPHHDFRVQAKAEQDAIREKYNKMMRPELEEWELKLRSLPPEPYIESAQDRTAKMIRHAWADRNAMPW